MALTSWKTFFCSQHLAPLEGKENRYDLNVAPWHRELNLPLPRTGRTLQEVVLERGKRTEG